MQKVSIVIPAYNRADLLPFTLDSVLAQTHRDLEVIVMDNASTDATPALMAAYQARDPRIRYFRNAINVGMVPNYNLGLKHATGSCVCYLDSDDTIEPTKLEKQVRYLAVHPEVNLVYTRFYNIDFEGRRLNQTWLLPEGDLFPTLMLRHFAFFGSLLIRKDFMLKMGGYDPTITMAADWDFYLRSALAGARFGCLQELLGSYRLHANNATRNATAEERMLLLILERALAHPNLPPSARALETQARTSIRLWLAQGCCTGGQWDDMQRNLRAALQLNPDWRSDVLPLLGSLRNMAVSIRVPDPIAFLERLLAHWPEDMPLSPAHRTSLASEVRFGYALRLFAHERPDEASREIKAAIAMNPALLSDAGLLEGMLLEQSVTAVADSPLDYLRRVFGALPPEAKTLQKRRQSIEASAHMAAAFDGFQNRSYSETRRNALVALINRPVLVRNRGLLSILARTILRAESGGGGG